MAIFMNSINTVIAARSATAPTKTEQKKETEREQQKEAYSSACSGAARAMALAGINLGKVPEKTPGVSYIDGINATVVKETTGDEANQWWKEEMNYDQPPYLPHSKVQHVKLEEDTTFVRVYDGENSGMYGGWVMKAQDIEGLSPAEIQDKFALPQEPVLMCDVTLPKGTELRTGLCNPLEGWGKGGGVQFDMMGQRVGEFGNERPIVTDG